MNPAVTGLSLAVAGLMYLSLLEAANRGSAAAASVYRRRALVVSVLAGIVVGLALHLLAALA